MGIIRLFVHHSADATNWYEKYDTKVKIYVPNHLTRRIEAKYNSPKLRKVCVTFALFLCIKPYLRHEDTTSPKHLGA